MPGAGTMTEVNSREVLADLVADGQVVVLTGAGLSTESGIPDYRGPSGSLRNPTPMTYQTFTGSQAARRRYWARSHLGWQRISGASPNQGHVAVHRLEQAGLTAGIVTQNVDGLHAAAGSPHAIELHGALSRVVCLGCRLRSHRADLDDRLRAANAAWSGRVLAVRPDGDVDVADEALDAFHVVDCDSCGGVLKPDVVFFGESVPRERVERSYALVESAGCLLVLGSSLTVMSGYRFVLRAAKLDIPVAIVNQGATRGDPQAAVRVDGPLGLVLTQLAEQLAPAPAQRQAARTG